MTKSNKKKILFVYNYTVVEPLALLFLQNYVDDHGHYANLIDYQSISKDYDFKDYDYVGFSVMTGSHKPMFEIADRIKNNTLEKKVLIGGAHTIFFSEDSKKHANFVVRGFGERILLKILNGEIKEEGIYSERTPPADLLISNRDKLYKDKKRRDNPIKNNLTSFCCPWKCNYCYNSIVQEEFPDYRFTTRPLNYVIRECKELLKTPLKIIHFQDDTFGVNMKWLKEFSERYSKEIKIPFHCNTRADIVTDERIRLYKEAGCESVTFSIECASDKLRKELLEKPITNQQIYNAAEILRKYNITFRTQQMLGLPETTIEDDINLLKLNCEIKPLFASATIFTPMRGTPLTEYCVKKGYYNPENEIDETFFGRSTLNFSERRKDQLTILHKLFGVLSYIPKGWELGQELIEKDKFDLNEFYTSSKSHLFDVMYHLNKEEAKKTRKDEKK